MVDRPVYNDLMTAAASTLGARDRILQTAHDLFYQDGIRATGVDRVIAASGVAKLTFYRHFPSKNDLIRAYLAHRHERWMSWFQAALARHGQNAQAITPAVGEWLRDPTYRGCAFLNTVSELAGVMPEVIEITRCHKADMIGAIAAVLPADQAPLASAVALAVDGAIVRAQFDCTAEVALVDLDRIVQSLLATTLHEAFAPPDSSP